MFLFLFVLISQMTFPDEGKFDPGHIYYVDSVIIHSYDVLHYDIEVEFYSPFDTLSGICIMTSKAVITIDSIPVHLAAVMQIDSILVDGVNSSYIRIEDSVYINFSSTVNPDEIFYVTTYYEGKPDTGLFQGMNGFYTFTEVYEASKQWFPCFDYCWDKADSGVDLHITVPDSLYALSNGIVISIDTITANRYTYHWEHNHSIATYLVAISAYNYVIIERSFHGYPLIYYAIPGYEQLAEDMLDSTEVILSLYDTLIDIYPFADEKLGQCQSSNWAAMEHQTCILYGLEGCVCASDPGTHAHEIAHSWWGDEVTCINYNQMFMNEGTTSYYECLGIEALRGEQGFYDKLLEMRDIALSWDDYYHFPIINCPIPFGTTVYYKGAWFHHMLRYLVGDSLYFPAMREYYQLHRGGNVSVTDLQNVMELHYQDSLGWFFHQWLEETDYPLLNVRWFYNGIDELKIAVLQVQTFGPSVFKIPIEFGLWYEDSLVTEGPFWMEDTLKTILISTVKPDSVTVDPNIKLYYKLDNIITANNILLVDDDGGGSFQGKYTGIFDLIGISYISWDCNQQGLPPDSISNNVKAIIWITGDEVDPLSHTDRDKIGTIIANDVPIAIFSPLAPDQLQGTAFLSDTLGCLYTGNTTNLTDFIGVTGDPIGDGCQWFCVPVHNSSVVNPGSNGAGCIYWDTSGYGIIRNDIMFLVFSTIDIKYIYNQSGYNTKEELIVRILNYLGIPVSVGVEEIVEVPVEVEDNSILISYLPGGIISLHTTSQIPTELCIYDITGRIVQSWDVVGERVIEWRGEDVNGRILPGGRYFAVMRSNLLSRQIILLK